MFNEVKEEEAIFLLLSPVSPNFFYP